MMWLLPLHSRIKGTCVFLAAATAACLGFVLLLQQEQNQTLLKSPTLSLDDQQNGNPTLQRASTSEVQTIHGTKNAYTIIQHNNTKNTRISSVTNEKYSIDDKVYNEIVEYDRKYNNMDTTTTNSVERELQIGQTQHLIKIQVIDTQTNQIIIPDLKNFTVIDLKQLNVSSPGVLAIEAVTRHSAHLVKSMHIKMNAAVKYNEIPSKKPYSLCGVNETTRISLACSRLSVGVFHNLITIAYSEKDTQGDELETYHIVFKITYGEECKIPKLLGSWQAWQPYPMNVTDAVGIALQGKFMIFGGFNTSSYNSSTSEVYSYNINTQKLNLPWEKMTNVPIPYGIAQSAITSNKTDTVYVCGGFSARNTSLVSTHVSDCLQFKPLNSGSQYVNLPPIPDGGRGGGAIFYFSYENQLVYTSGAQRPGGSITVIHDKNESWILNLNNTSLGWQSLAPIPYLSHFAGYATSWYAGFDRHYVVGGITGGGRTKQYRKEMYELSEATHQWIKRADLPYARSSAGTAAYGCGFFVIGGIMNRTTTNSSNVTLTDDISFYSSNSNTWTSIGTLPMPIKSPVCRILQFGGKGILTTLWLTCQSGSFDTPFAWRRKLPLHLYQDI